MKMMDFQRYIKCLVLAICVIFIQNIVNSEGAVSHEVSTSYDEEQYAELNSMLQNGASNDDINDDSESKLEYQNKQYSGNDYQNPEYDNIQNEDDTQKVDTQNVDDTQNVEYDNAEYHNPGEVSDDIFVIDNINQVIHHDIENTPKEGSSKSDEKIETREESRSRIQYDEHDAFDRLTKNHTKEFINTLEANSNKAFEASEKNLGGYEAVVLDAPVVSPSLHMKEKALDSKYLFDVSASDDTTRQSPARGKPAFVEKSMRSKIIYIWITIVSFIALSILLYFKPNLRKYIKPIVLFEKMFSK